MLYYIPKFLIYLRSSLCIHCHHYYLLVSFYFINEIHLMNINVRYKDFFTLSSIVEGIVSSGYQLVLLFILLYTIEPPAEKLNAEDLWSFLSHPFGLPPMDDLEGEWVSKQYRANCPSCIVL